MNRILVGLSLSLILAIAPEGARAQYGYPTGYGGYGWGGWGGGSLAGSTARGMGAFNMGRGVYNVDTAQARSINTDTAMRFNNYMFQSMMAAGRRYRNRSAARQAEAVASDRGKQDRLRNNPELNDITDGDALNVMLEVLLNPATAGRSLQYIKTPLHPEIIRDIPFEVATEGMAVCLDSMTMDGQWPLALRDDKFKPEREGVRNAVKKALKHDEQGTLSPETVEAVGKAINALRLKFEELTPQDNPDYIPARNTIKGMAGLTRMLYSPKMEKVIAELEDYQGTDLGELLGFMQAFNLRFGPTNSYRQRQIYTKLYPMLAEQANGTLGGPAAGTAGQAVGAAEDMGGKAVEGLKSASADLFKDMGWEHLLGRK